jgi:hypothetical protein
MENRPRVGEIVVDFAQGVPLQVVEVAHRSVGDHPQVSVDEETRALCGVTDDGRVFDCVVLPTGENRVDPPSKSYAYSGIRLAPVLVGRAVDGGWEWVVVSDQVLDVPQPRHVSSTAVYAGEAAWHERAGGETSRRMGRRVARDFDSETALRKLDAFWTHDGPIRLHTTSGVWPSSDSRVDSGRWA